MAKFAWIQYLDLADKLSTDENSASHRAAVSRAYYAIFNIILERLKQDGGNRL